MITRSKDQIVKDMVKETINTLLDGFATGEISPEITPPKQVWLDYLIEVTDQMKLPDEKTRRIRGFPLTIELAKLGHVDVRVVAETEGYPMDELRAVYSLLFE
jgi:hypothetical protein